MSRVLVLGATGMLGSMFVDTLGAEPDLEVVAGSRDGEPAFDATIADAGDLLDRVEPGWVVNAVGLLRARIDDSAPAEAIEVNAAFPHRLAAAAATRRVRVIGVATDGVFSGRDGPYAEDAPHDGAGVYAQTKSLGEVAAGHVLNLRCSIVGPERGAPPRSLLGWLLDQPQGARVPGFSDRRWNGVTTLHFARIALGVIGSAAPPPHGTLHVVPGDVVTKAELLRIIARAHGRDDLEVVETASGAPTDHTLSTGNPAANAALWRAAGHREPPTVAEMVGELAARTRR